MTKILHSKPVVEHLTVKLKEQCSYLKKNGALPSLKVILVGNSPASLVYTQNKKKFCEKIGAFCEIIQLPEDYSKKLFIELLTSLTKNKNVHGIIVQLPLPSHLEEIKIDEYISPEKDVDGFHALNQGSLLLGKLEGHMPCTPKGVMELLHYYKIPIKGKNAVIVGRSNIVGKPMSMMLLQEDATVTICHSKTQDLAFFTKNADIVVSAIGRPNFLTSHFFDSKKQTTVIDVGINRNQQGKLCGDVDFEHVKSVVGAITPVPGGVGPMTVLILIQNLLQATQNSLV